MKIMFISLKGGQGKTTHAMSYAHHKGWKVISNDVTNGTLETYQDYFSKGQLKIIKPGEQIPTDQDKTVYDFGGWGDSRIIQVTKAVDLCVIPIFCKSNADIIPAIKTINTIQPHNNNILILINMTERQLASELEDVLKGQYHYPILKINNSNFVNRFANQGETIFDIEKKGGLERSNLIRHGLLQQYTELYNYLDNAGKHE